ncbi:transposase, partial [Fusibacter ferrireducens]
MAKQKRNKAPKELMAYLFDNYELKNALDVQEALKDMFSETLETMLNSELDEHLGYSKSENTIDHTTNRRNGKSAKTVKSQLGEFDLNIPRDREASFEPQVV